MNNLQLGLFWLLLESFLLSLVRVNLIKISDSISPNDCTVQRTYLVKDTSYGTLYTMPSVNEANLIISDQQANFRGGNIRLEEIGWGGEEGRCSEAALKACFQVGPQFTHTYRLLPLIFCTQIPSPMNWPCLLNIYDLYWDFMPSHVKHRGVPFKLPHNPLLCYLQHSVIWSLPILRTKLLAIGALWIRTERKNQQSMMWSSSKVTLPKSWSSSKVTFPKSLAFTSRVN